MIQPSELRIGNFVEYNGGDDLLKINRITGVSLNSVVFKGIYPPIPLTVINPILLTPEILEKCTLKKGFGTIIYSNGKETKEYHLSYPIVLVGNVVNESYSVFYKYTCGWQNEDDFICEIEFLHQLQNLFFTLTNEELIINL
jgi:hypothetical protein